MFKEQEKRIFHLLEKITNLGQFQDNMSVCLNKNEESEKNNITSIEIKSYFDGGRYIELILKRDGDMHTSTIFSCMKDHDGKFKYHEIQDNIKMGDDWGKLNYHTIERKAFPFLYHRVKTNPFTDSVTFLVNEAGVTERLKLDDYNYRYNDLPF